ncbi:MAG: hypothetical protein KDA65_14225 [Planctomycetaceae bacterium]|nr:hypothetical protein [Planctomycetaceae bacterium]
MAASFAGARNLDERRRRRLATASEDLAVPPTRRSPSTSPSDEEESGSHKVASVALFPVRKLISPRTWKHYVVGLILLTISGLILAAGLHLDSRPEQFGPGFQKLFNFESGRAVNYFSGGLMTLAGQIAFLIWWARSRSLHDYNGNYRVWAWASTVGIVFGFCLLTEAHVAFSLTVFWLWNLDFWKQDVLCWLAPTLVITGGLFWPLRHDMFECKPSRSLFALAAGCWVIVAFMQIGFDFPVAENQQAARASVGMVGALSFFMSMLMHARFVLYETAEAPVVVQKQSLTSKAWENVWMNVSGFGSRFTQLFKRSSKKPKKPKASKQETKPSKAAPKPIQTKKTETTTAVQEAGEESDEQTEQPKKKLRFRLKSDATPNGNTSPQWEEVQEANAAEEDSFDDDENLQHLSRKERKKLKKMNRQQSRRAS